VRSRTAFIFTASLALVSAASSAAHAQVLTYSKGQPISAAYEGWEVDPDGAKYFIFGYENKNWEEEMDIPVGPENGFQPGPIDRGQPTHFFPRRNRYVFRVPVPSQFSERDELVWTLTTHGRTSKAYASLRLDLILDAVAKGNDTGASGMSSSPETRANKPPVVEIEGSRTRTVKVGQPLVLVATVTDDGVPRATTEEQARNRLRRNTSSTNSAGQGSSAGPGSGASSASGAEPGTGSASPSSETPPVDIWRNPPSQGSVRKSNGLHFSWFHLRGPGPVKFDPPQIKTWEDLRVGANSPWAPVWFPPPLPADGRLTTTVTFGAPGTYVLRGRGDDGPATTDEDVTVTVIP
jgi:hypothetical protein